VLTFVDLFAGIGGFSLGLETAGIKCVGQVEIDDYCNLILEKHWPDVKRIRDIRDVRGDEFGTVGLVCGGVPCQPASQAGKRRGTKDDRWLWPEALRVLRAIKPTWVLFENVYGFVSLNDGLEFNQVLTEMESIGYEVQPFIVPACAVDAPHRRDRVWIVGYRVEQGLEGLSGNGAGGCREEWKVQESNRPVGATGVRRGAWDVADSRHPESPRRQQGSEGSEGETCGESTPCGSSSQGWRAARSTSEEISEPATEQRFTRCSGGDSERRGAPSNTGRRGSKGPWGVKLKEQNPARWLPEPDVGRVATGIPSRVDRLRALGNAVVPPLVTEIGKMILAVDTTPTMMVDCR